MLAKKSEIVAVVLVVASLCRGVRYGATPARRHSAVATACSLAIFYRDLRRLFIYLNLRAYPLNLRPLLGSSRRAFSDPPFALSLVCAVIADPSHDSRRENKPEKETCD